MLVLLRIKRKLMNIDCRLLKSRTAMTSQWDLVPVNELLTSTVEPRYKEVGYNKTLL